MNQQSTQGGKRIKPTTRHIHMYLSFYLQILGQILTWGEIVAPLLEFSFDFNGARISPVGEKQCSSIDCDGSMPIYSRWGSGPLCQQMTLRHDTLSSTVSLTSNCEGSRGFHFSNSILSNACVGSLVCAHGLFNAQGVIIFDIISALQK